MSLNRSRDEFYRGMTDEAEGQVENVRIGSRNKVLVLMERGLIYQANRKYEKSNHDLLEAAKEVDELETIRIVGQAGSFLSSDLALTYGGESFEKVLVHTYSAINFLMLEKWEDALVECKRALRKLDSSPFPNEQLFTNYLAGICYEMMGDYDDARIEYEKVKKAHPGSPFIEADLKRISGAGTKDKGELICFVQIGKSPVKRQIEFFVPPDKRFVIPEYRQRSYICRRATVLVSPSGKEQEVPPSDSYFLTNLDTLAPKSLNDRMQKEIAREIARLATKEQVSHEIEEKTSETTAALVRLIFLLAESADVRNWQTLPAKLGVARVSLSPGTYDVKIQFLDANNGLVEDSLFKHIKVEQARRTFLLSRSSL